MTAGTVLLGELESARGKAATLPRGTHIGRYIVLQEIGAGATSVVYKAADPELDRQVAIKVLHVHPRPGSMGSGSQTRLLNEAKALAQLSHPNVITVHDVGAIGEQIFIAMELVEGQTLRKWLAEQQRHVTDIISVFAAAGRGLYAAHEAGLIHGDFKPANVIVGRDDRIRVLDFGLARRAASASIPDPDNGVLVGTPAYMAPEQYAEQSICERSDQFSFCVALYEALYANRPFAGTSVAELRTSVLEGRVREPPQSRRVPTSLRRALMRGLSSKPEDRFPSMCSLLAEIERKPLTVRIARMLAPVAVTLTILAISAGAWFAWRQHRAAEETRARESAAATRLLFTNARIETLLAKGDQKAADEEFLAFVHEARNRNTQALTRAWLDRAQRMKEAGRFDRELAAYATAYTTAVGDRQQGNTLLQLAWAFHQRRAWNALDTVLASLADHPADAIDPDELLELRWATALARRDLPGALAVWEDTRSSTLDESRLGIDAAPAIAALSSAKRTRYPKDWVFLLDVDGDGTNELLFRDYVGKRFTATRAHHTLPLLWTQTMPSSDADSRLEFVWQLPMQPGQAPYVLSRERSPNADRLALLRLQPHGLEAIKRWNVSHVMSAAVGDFDGDGHREAVIGTGPYTRTLYQLQLTAGGDWSLLPTTGGVANARSDVSHLLTADLDRDGRTELVAALGPWHAYDLRVLGRAPDDGEFEVLARRKLGSLGALALLPSATGDYPLVATIKGNAYPNRRVFPEHALTGEPCGLYLFRWHGGDLIQTGFTAVPDATASSHGLELTHLTVADVDGDGIADLLANATDTRPGVMLYRQRPNGTFTAVFVGGITVVAAVDLDGDPADELIVEVVGDDRFWLLGVGTDELPALAMEGGTDALPVPAVVAEDSTLARVWSRTEDLIGMSLTTQAAELFEHLGTTGAEGAASKHRAWYRAAQLWEHAGDHGRAALAYERSAEMEELAVPGLQAAQRNFMRADQYRQALQVTRALLARSDLPADARTANTRQAEWLGSLECHDELVISFDEPLADYWQIDQPVSVRRDIRARTLAVDAFSGQGQLASVAVQRTEGRIALHVEMDVERTEWASRLDIALRAQADQREGIAVAVAGGGGGGVYHRTLGCPIYMSSDQGFDMADDYSSVQQPMSSPETRISIHASVQFIPGPNHILCTVTDGQGQELHHSRIALTEPLPDGEYELTIADRSKYSNVDAFWLRAHIRRMVISGFRLTPPAAQSELLLGHRMLADDRVTAAKKAYDAAVAVGHRNRADHQFGTILALANLGRYRQAGERVRRAMGAREDIRDRVQRYLSYALRSRAHTFGPLLRESLGPRYFALFEQSWGGATYQHMDDPLVVRALTTGLFGLHELSGEQLGIHGVHKKFVLLDGRGGAWRRLGRYSAARQDLLHALKLSTALLDGTAAVDDNDALGIAGRLQRIYRQLAILEASLGNRELALQHARSSLRAAHDSEIALDQLLQDSELASLQDVSTWESMVRGQTQAGGHDL